MIIMTLLGLFWGFTGHSVATVVTLNITIAFIGLMLGEIIIEVLVAFACLKYLVSGNKDE